MSNVEQKISGVGAVTRGALEHLDRSERFTRNFSIVVLSAVFVLSKIELILVFSYGSSQLNRLKTNQAQLKKQGADITQTLQILEQYTNPAIVNKNQVQTQKLIYCVINRIDTDTNRGTLDPTCQAVLNPIPVTAITTPKTAAASSSSMVTFTGQMGSQGATGSMGPVGPQGPRGFQG